MARTRRRFAARFIAKVALEAIRGLRAVQEIAQEFHVHPKQVTLLKKQLLASAEQVIESGSGKSPSSDEPSSAMLYEQIGRLKMELEWRKNGSSLESVGGFRTRIVDARPPSTLECCALVPIAKKW